MKNSLPHSCLIEVLVAGQLKGYHEIWKTCLRNLLYVVGITHTECLGCNRFVVVNPLPNVSEIAGGRPF